MSDSIKTLEKEISVLLDKKKQLEGKLSQAIFEAIKSVASENLIHRLSDRVFIVKLSDIVGSPLQPEFYDWEKSAQIMIKFLRTKPVTEWTQALQRKLDESNLSSFVIFEYRHTEAGKQIVDKVPVSKTFIRKVIERL